MNVPGGRQKFRARSPRMERRPQIKKRANTKGSLGLRIKPMVFVHRARPIFKGDTTLAEPAA